MPTSQHRRFDQGFIQDEASFLLPEGALYSSKNMLFDKVGIARKRGGVTGLGSTATYAGLNLGVMIDTKNNLRLYANRDSLSNGMDFINPATGAITSTQAINQSDNNFSGGRPFLHHGCLCFPQYSPVTVFNARPIWVAGASGSVAQYTLTTPASLVVTAGNARITVAAADNPLTNMQVGQIFVWQNTALASGAYRITRLVNSTHFEVWPIPDFTPTSITGGVAFNCLDPVNIVVNGQLPSVGGLVGMSHQGRVVLGNLSRSDGVYNDPTPRRVWFSSLLLEGDVSGNVTVARMYGLTFMANDGYPALNYFDIPVQEGITAMAPTGFGDAIIFTGFRAFRLTGNLTTQYGTTQSITWAVREIPNSVGCMSERSMRRTPRGLVFAHDSGVYATDGASLRPLMSGKISGYWKSLVAGPSFAIYGSGVIYGNHYYICGVSNSVLWGLMLNLDTLAWSVISGKSSMPASWFVLCGEQDPITPSRTWGLKAASGGGSASMTNGQLVKLESMFDPNSATKADNDNTTVNFEVVTRAYTEDSPTIQKTWEKATIEYENIGGPGVAVTPAAVLDSAEMPAGGTSTFLPRQDVYTVTAASNASPIVITCGTHDIKVDSWVHVQGVGGNTNANGPFRVLAVTGTTVTLMGSYGNAAYTSGGTIQNMDQRDIDLNTVSQGAQSNQSAMVYRINDTDSGGTQGADGFELYGITHSWSERDPHAE